MEELEPHYLCGIFPHMTQEEAKDLCEDIEKNGQLIPIVIYEGQILDGAHRYAVCEHLGIKPIFEEYTGNDPVGFVVSMNMKRRHLTPGQSAAVVANVQDWEKAYRQGKSQEKSMISDADFEKERCNAAPLAETPQKSSVADRAKLAGVSKRTQIKADKVAKADPELIKKVAQGDISLEKAVKQVSKIKEPEPEPLEMDWKQEFIIVNQELDRINLLVKSLEEIDTKKEIVDWSTKFHQLNLKLIQEIITSNEAKKQATYQAKILAKLRKHFNVESNKDLLKVAGL